MTFTFIIMDSLYIMRNLLMIFFLMVVFWTNLGNCEGGCDRYTQCHYNETRMHSTVSCNIERAGDTAPPCYGDGSNISCSCSENYQLSSTDNSYLCRPDKWEDGLYDLHCLPSPCDEPAPPDDLVIHSPDFAEGEMYANGIEIMYDCPDGWDFNGHMTAVCLSGVWTYEDAYCTASPCDEPAPPDNLVFYSPDFAEGEMYAHGTEIMYGCPDGWDLNGHMTAVCLYGVWTYEDANCTASPCDEPAPPDDLVSHSRNFAEGEMYANGTEIMYFCPDGWDLNGNMTAVCLYGVWTYEDANCTVQASSCDKPAPPDDLVIHSPDFAEGEIYPNGTEIMYDCPEGWYINGHRTAVCLSGVWTYEDAFCTDSCDKYTQCFLDEARVNSTVSCDVEIDGNTEPPCYGHGSKLNCSCNSENYHLSSYEDSYLCIPRPVARGVRGVRTNPPPPRPDQFFSNGVLAFSRANSCKGTSTPGAALRRTLQRCKVRRGEVRGVHTERRAVISSFETWQSEILDPIADRNMQICVCILSFGLATTEETVSTNLCVSLYFNFTIVVIETPQVQWLLKSINFTVYVCLFSFYENECQ
ncbi:complement factor H-like isoform X3 [Apostichopus japonicus]|uniref:complement factor H-like isoform X3 n=1 Tax=Stichopus japonicus TaxID=307972 RepID=UPI003AB487F2